jgi:HEAT repeats
VGFKEDADFARFVSMGAAGTAAVGRFLRDVHGHRPIELERYAMANKVWQTKVKRLRLPDLVCVHCGRRIESRAKSKLGIVVSHSERLGRAWNEGGMRPSDLYAFVRADIAGDRPVVGQPMFFTSAALNEVFGSAKRSVPKAASEGSEVTLSWPSWVPIRSGTVQGIDDQGRIVCQWDDGRTYRYWQWEKWSPKGYLYAAPPARIVAGETMVAGVVPMAVALDCPGEGWDIAAALHDSDEAERYAGIKAAGILGKRDLTDDLVRIESSESDWRIKLEAAAALARMDPQTWTKQVIASADETTSRDEARMEAVFALGEIPTDEAANALAAIAMDDGNANELRAAAAWGLGRGVHPRPDLLLPLTISEERLVSLHAIVALETLPETLVPELLARLGSADDRIAASAAHLLSRNKAVKPLLEAVEEGGSARDWALSALGDLPPDLVRGAVSGELDHETERTLQPMWLGQRDWLRQDEGRDGLEALDVQTVRFDPADLAE